MARGRVGWDAELRNANPQSAPPIACPAMAAGARVFQPLRRGADGRLLFDHDGACPSTRQVDLIGSLACAAV
ncbi:MAG: hypothetical protein M3430_02865 [Acidobacteriota bacterium]|nr:hypothetical protein [Acidobacteriota bacterium]